ncbi:helix-hairpin-helix domain-containing protein [Thioalkalivibrio sp.]|uniref:helix-hairpin-helix domain-containing protein n=1 Tax=Thioalkalivibrio sp. TaxID=2093813 RepID=UPI0035616CB4
MQMDEDREAAWQREVEEREAAWQRELDHIASLPHPLSEWTPWAFRAVAYPRGMSEAKAERVRAAFPSPADLLDATAEELIRRVPAIGPTLAARVRWELLQYANRASEEMYRRAVADGKLPSRPRGWRGLKLVRHGG